MTARGRPESILRGPFRSFFSSTALKTGVLVAGLALAFLLVSQVLANVGGPGAGDKPVATVDPDTAGAAARYEVVFWTPSDLAAGLDTITIQFEDDVVVPTVINPSNVSITATHGTNRFGGATGLLVANPISVTTELVGIPADETEVRILIGDMGPGEPGIQGIAGLPLPGSPMSVVTVIFSPSAGLTNPTEGTKDYRVKVKTSQDTTFINSTTYNIPRGVVLDDDVGNRGQIVTAVGRGFQNGTTATLWLDNDQDGVRDSTETVLGTGLVGSDDTFTVSFTINVPPFIIGGVPNQIRAIDGQNNVDDGAIATFLVVGLLSATPKVASIGDTVIVNIKDWPADEDPTDVTGFTLGGVNVFSSLALLQAAVSISGGEDTFTFQIPSGVAPGVQELRLTTPSESGTQNMTILGVTFTVNSTNDAVDVIPGNGVCETSTPAECTLRAAIMETNALPGPDAIALPARTYSLALSGTGEDLAATGDLDITGDLFIDGAGPDTTIIDAGGIDRVFEIHSGTTVDIADVTIQNGALSDGGGGIFIVGTLNLTNTLVNGNSGTDGGGIKNAGILNMTASTVSGNSAGISGGGIQNTLNATLVSNNSTVSGNTSTDGGGIANFGTLVLANSTLSANSASSGGGIHNIGTAELINTIVASSPSGGDCFGSGISSLGHNLDSDGTCNLTATTDLPNTDPLAGPLQDNGGPTFTHALLPGSPAIDVIPFAECTDNDGNPVTTDQRGTVRPKGTGCDIGAYEGIVLVHTVGPAIVQGGATASYQIQADNLTNLAVALVTFTYDAARWDLVQSVLDPAFIGCLEEVNETPPGTLMLGVICPVGHTGDPLAMWEVTLTADPVALPVETTISVSNVTLGDINEDVIGADGSTEGVLITLAPPVDVSLAGPDSVLLGSTTSYDIQADDVANLAVALVTFTYDAALWNPVQSVLDPAFSGCLGEINDTTPGTLLLGLVCSEGHTGTQLPLWEVTVTAIGVEDNQQTQLSVTDVSLGSIDEQDILARGLSLDVTLKSIVCGDIHPGDGGDGDVDALDALRALKIAIGLIVPSAAEQTAGDVHPDNDPDPDGDGDIDVLDAQRILNAAVGVVTITSCGGPFS